MAGPLPPPAQPATVLLLCLVCLSDLLRLHLKMHLTISLTLVSVQCFLCYGSKEFKDSLTSLSHSSDTLCPLFFTFLPFDSSPFTFISNSLTASGPSSPSILKAVQLYHLVIIFRSNRQLYTSAKDCELDSL